MSSLLRRHFRRTPHVPLQPVSDGWAPTPDERTAVTALPHSCPELRTAEDDLAPLRQRVDELARQRQAAIDLARLVERVGTEMEGALARRFLLALGVPVPPVKCGAVGSGMGIDGDRVMSCQLGVHGDEEWHVDASGTKWREIDSGRSVIHETRFDVQ